MLTNLKFYQYPELKSTVFCFFFLYPIVWEVYKYSVIPGPLRVFGFRLSFSERSQLGCDVGTAFALFYRYALLQNGVGLSGIPSSRLFHFSVSFVYPQLIYWWRLVQGTLTAIFIYFTSSSLRCVFSAFVEIAWDVSVTPLALSGPFCARKTSFEEQEFIWSSVL
jgi:hypothetical protein